MDMKVFVDADPDVRLARRSVMAQFFTLWVYPYLLPVTCYLSATRLVAHKAFTEHFHLSWSAATIRTSFHDFQPASSLSFSTVHLQVVFGLPLLLLPSGAQIIAMLQLLFWSCLSINYVQSSSIYVTSLLHSAAPCLLFQITSLTISNTK